jgi:hypothetical protein
LGLSIRQSLAFFEKFRLGLDVVNVSRAILYTYTPKVINKDLSPSRLQILIHNNHCYKLNDSARFKLQKMKTKTELNNDLDKISTLVISNKYHIRKPLLEDIEIHYIENLDDCIKFIHSCKTEKIRFITNNSLTNLLFDMISQNHIPGINYSSGKILSLTFSIGKILATLESSNITRDIDQLQPIDFKVNNISNLREYQKYCINQMFPNQLKLKISKRLKTEDDRNKLRDLKKEIFENPKNIIKILEKYKFKTCRSLKDIKTLENICYFNFRTDTVNNHIHNLVTKPEKTVIINKIPYWEGLELICKKHYSVKSKGIRLFVNYAYKIQKISSESFTICDKVENVTLLFQLRY